MNNHYAGGHESCPDTPQHDSIHANTERIYHDVETLHDYFSGDTCHDCAVKALEHIASYLPRKHRRDLKRML